MDAISFSVFRSKLADTLDRVNENHKPILITRQNGKPAVAEIEADKILNKDLSVDTITS